MSVDDPNYLCFSCVSVAILSSSKRPAKKLFKQLSK